MNMHKWNCLNGEGLILKSIYTGKNDISIASNKVKARFGDNACFVKLEYVGEVPMEFKPLVESIL